MALKRKVMLTAVRTTERRIQTSRLTLLLLGGENTPPLLVVIQLEATTQQETILLETMAVDGMGHPLSLEIKDQQSTRKMRIRKDVLPRNKKQ
jgi:hypothetical protein